MIMMSAEPRIYTNDVDYPYRQENNFYYLTALKQENATLVLLPGNGRFQEVLFIPKKNPSREAWTGKMYGKDNVRRLSGVQAVLYDEELQPFLESLKAKKAFTSKEGAGTFSTASLLAPRAEKQNFISCLRIRTLTKTASGNFRVKRSFPLIGKPRVTRSKMRSRFLRKCA